MTRLIAVVVLVLASACTKPWYVGTDHIGRRQPPPRVAVTGSAAQDGAPGISLSRKTVSAKEEPGTLIAADRTRCVVPAERFREVALGEKVTCGWQ